MNFSDLLNTSIHTTCSGRLLLKLPTAVLKENAEAGLQHILCIASQLIRICFSENGRVIQVEAAYTQEVYNNY